MWFEVYSTRPVAALGRKRWRWRLKSRNGEIIASGEDYINRADCLHAVELVKKSNTAKMNQIK